MNERGAQVQRLLATLAKHGDLVAEAFDGAVVRGDKARNGAIAALRDVNALKADDEDTYRLNPRLREYISDHLSTYHAFQALRRVSGVTAQARRQWEEMRQLKRSGARRDLERLEAALDESIVEMAYSIEHNLLMLHSLISTQYGNVDNLQSKLRQNRYYANQVRVFLQDVEAIDTWIEQVGDQATADGLPQIRQLVARRLGGAKHLLWTSQIKDAQQEISKRLFEAKRMETRLKQIARFALWLGRNRTIDGWDLPVDATLRADILRPESIPVRPQPDVAENEPIVRQALISAAAKLPARPVVTLEQEEAPPQLLIEDDPVALEELEPHQYALHELITFLTTSHGRISLLQWKDSRPELARLEDEAWLMFAGLQLKGAGFRVRYLHDALLDPFPVNEPFFDIEASPIPGDHP